MRRRYGRWLFLIVLLGGIAAFSGLWYAAAGHSSRKQPVFGGDYIEGVAGAPLRVNPLFAAQNSADQSLVALVFAGLTRLDDQGSAFPDLAQTWSLSPDGRTYTFQLRDGLLWQDGTELTADDVVFTYTLLQTPGLRSPPPLSQLLAGATMTKISKQSFSLTLPQANSTLPSYLTVGILPAHLLQNQTADAIFDAPFNQHPIGAGPYRLEDLTPDRAVLVANPAYHLGQPFVQHMELRFYRDDGALLSALKEHQVAGALFTTALSDADMLYLQRRSDLHLTALSTTETAFVFLNLNRAPFGDLRLRQALLYALDRDQIIQDVLQGQAKRADSPIAPGSWAYSGALSRYGTDMAVANTLLDEAGWVKGSDGVRTKGASRLAFTLLTSSDAVQFSVASAIADRWKQIGVSATVQAVGSTELIRDDLEPRAFDAVLFNQIAPADPDPYSIWDSSQTGSKGGNLSSWDDAQVDKALEEAQTAAQPQRKELYADFQEQFAQQVPSLPLYTTTQLYVQPSALRGSRPGLVSDSGSRFWRVQDWYLKTR